MSLRSKNIVFTVLVLACMTVVFLFRGDYAITLGFADDVLTVDGPQGLLYSVPFEELESLRLYDEGFDFGSRISGEDKYGYVFGVYDSPELGEYELCAEKRVSHYIAAVSKDGKTVVFNKENNTTVDNLYKALTEYLGENGYAVRTE